jgi:tetratricopeptide (TPR) repeat protein
VTKPALMSPAALSRLLADQAATRGSGIIRATRGKLRRLFCMQNGALIHAVSNVIEEQIDEQLTRGGVLAAVSTSAAVTESVRSGTKFSRAVLELGLLPEAELKAGIAKHVQTLLASTLEWTDGTFEFEAGRPNLDGEVVVTLSPIPTILESARKSAMPLDLVRTKIGPPDARPAMVPERRAMIDAAGLDDETLFLLERCDGSRTVPEIVAESLAGEEVALRTLYGLMMAGGVAADREAVAFTRRGTTAVPLQRDECLAILQRTGAADHYTLLGLTRTAPVEEVRRSYYGLARRYHPDRFRAGALGDLLPRFEHFFSLVTEAYNTLSSADLRAQYDEQLAGPAEPETAKLSETAHLARENYNRGRALVERRRFNEAVTFLENAVRLDGRQAAYQLELGLLLARNPRRRMDAEQALIKTVEIEPTRVAAYLALGEMYQRAGRMVHAARRFREVLRWEPDHIEASRLLHEVGDPDGDVEFLKPVFTS